MVDVGKDFLECRYVEHLFLQNYPYFGILLYVHRKTVLKSLLLL